MDDVEKYKKRNVLLYPIYKMFSWDLVFYYAIIFLFLTIAKDIKVSQILLIEAVDTLASLVFQIPCVAIIDKIGKKKSLIIGNIAVSVFLTILLLSHGIWIVVIAKIIASFGFALKGLTESPLLYDSIDHKGKNEQFNIVEGECK